MKQPGTYIGFFKGGQTGDTQYWNFYPIAKLLGAKYEINFPYDDFFYQGRLQLKQVNTQYATPTLSNISISKIENAEEGVLHKVILDEAFFENNNERFFNRIELPEDCLIEDAIRVEDFTLSELMGNNASVLIDVKDLSQAAGYPKTCIFKDYYERSERSFSGGRANEVSFSILSEDKATISEGIMPKAMAIFDKKPAFMLDEPLKVYDAESSDIEIINLPVYAGKWFSDYYNNNHGYENVENVRVVRIKASALASDGRLIWDGKKRKCVLEEIGGKKKASKKKQPATGPFVPPATAEAADQAEKPENIVKRIQQCLMGSGRIVSEADVINYCICITQGFITTFAGAPGTGKTSLCRLLAKALGLQEKEELEAGSPDEPRYTEVSVERGWTSLKDFIGYPDPFATEDADRIVPSNVDVYEAFSRMDNESRKAADCSKLPPDLVLLDEANLSPIEYYWSQFLRNCQLDDEDELKQRKIQVSRKKAWLLSPNLRFLATVNFDHTTEELSPRFLDRTWVVTLEPPKMIGKRGRPALPASVSMETLQNLFGFPREGEEFPAETASIWNDIRGIFRDEAVNLPLSPRNINAVESYCIAAARFDEITAAQALDLAVLQKILPTISGYGERYDELTGKLKQIADENKMEKTARKLKAMRDAAEQNSSFYQFFIR